MQASGWCGRALLSLQIDNCPVFFTLLNVADVQLNCLMAPQPTRKQHGQKCSIPFLFQAFTAGNFYDCSAVSQFPSLTPIFLTPFTRRMPAARSGLRSPQSAAS